MTLDLMLAVGVLVPLASFVFLAFFGAKLPGVAAPAHGDDHGHDDAHGHGGGAPKVRRPMGGNPLAAYIATAAIGLSCVLATVVLVKWNAMTPAERTSYAASVTSAHTVEWARLGTLPIRLSVKLDSLTVIMFWMVSFVASWIHVFSIGYMSHDARFARFFTYLSLFCFSMLGLLISSSIVFLFVFWELVGLCSYFLIGFWFEKKSASNAAIKAFVTNRVGDFGFLAGLMMVIFFLKDVSLDGAAASFAALARDPGAALFHNTFWGMNWASWMGVLLFCGAVGKSAQFPLHVWLPDAMEGPTPVSALIHAATMVAAGVYLVARIFPLLTPQAQMVIATIGVITLTITALIAIAQTDIKKVLAYSTLSQLGYMVFGMGVGAWVGALFHLLTHAFFKALLFLGSGSVIDGCHHEQDMRRMGGLRAKMPVTCWTFFLAVLAIAGFGIPWTHVGLGGFHSKDEILAVAYQRAYLWDQPLHHEEEHEAGAAHAAQPETPAEKGSDAALRADERDSHAGAMVMGAPPHGAGGSLAALFPNVPALPRWMLWLPLIIAYVTPFYMMRCWYLTFGGRPRDEQVHAHAHEKPILWVPLAVLAAATVLCASFPALSVRNLVADAAHAVGGDASSEPVGARVTGLVPAVNGTVLHGAHEALGGLVGFAFVAGIGLAWVVYRNGLGLAAAIVRANALTRFAHLALERKLFFDDVYNFLLVGGTVVVAKISGLIDKIVVDGVVNGAAALTRVGALFAGRQLDMPVKDGDIGFVDLLVNGVGKLALSAGNAVRRPQSGRIRMYILTAAAAAACVLLFVAFNDEISRWALGAPAGTAAADAHAALH
ncbi:MAG: NADH-quinone oxidoreductase subunit L [Phycisphaerae bacterium]